VKVCTLCGIEKPLESFFKRSKKTGTLRSACKCCTSRNNIVYKQKHKEYLTQYHKEYYEKERERITENKREKYKNDLGFKENHLIFNETWRKNNPEKNAASSAKYRASKNRAIPLWTDELDKLLIEEAYYLSRMRTEKTGIGWHVDHTIPLNGKAVCGLHVGINLRVIPAVENLQKGNKYTN